MMQSIPKISIIIPVYNAEKYLPECLDSLLSQTFQDFEVICVDDGSTDRSADILREYAERDRRIRVFAQENFYAGAARNNGLSAAKGKYALFLDADDRFAPDLLEKACNAADEKEADIVLFGGRRLDDRTGKISGKREFLQTALLPGKPVFSAKDIPDAIFRITNPAPWTKLYRRDFLLSSGIRFQILPNSNDAYFTFATLAVAGRIAAVDADLVFYRINTGSSLQSNKARLPLCFMESIYELNRFLRKRGLHDFLRQSFLHIALSMTRYNLTAVGSAQGRFRILEEMQSPRFAALDILHPDEPQYYATSTAFSLAQFLTAALRQWGGYDRYFSPTHVSEIIPCRSPGEVKVSVVIPVYNTEAYLDETLSSITKQTLSEIEIICVNDGSTDQSLAALVGWAGKDPRISVLSQKNSGLAQSRNNGLDAARGKYVYFIDSDDYLDTDALAALYEKAEKDQLDALYFDAETFYDCPDPLAEEQKSFCGLYERKGKYPEVCDGPTLYEKMEAESEYRDSVPLQFLRREFLNEYNIRCPLGILHEDNAFSFNIILQAKRAAHLPRALYHRRIRANSIMTAQVSFRNAYGYFCSVLAMQETFFRLKDQLSPEARSAAARRISLKLWGAQDCYKRMPPAEAGSEYGIKEDFYLFMKLVKEPAELQKARDVSNKKLERANKEKTELNRKLQQLEKEKKKLAAEKSRLANSRSYRLGRFLSAPYRCLKKLLRG